MASTYCNGRRAGAQPAKRSSIRTSKGNTNIVVRPATGEMTLALVHRWWRPGRSPGRSRRGWPMLEPCPGKPARTVLRRAFVRLSAPRSPAPGREAAGTRRSVIAIPTDDGVRLRTQLACERKGCVPGAALAPPREAISLPALQELDPHSVGGEGYLDLRLLARRHPLSAAGKARCSATTTCTGRRACASIPG
jgi:hypothetical protein